ncbi:MAG TPA: TPM domain-containing protein [Polyangiaceae bacterium]|nr:TPM domain-containing protein [Polyangiaceae bacterium]
MTLARLLGLARVLGAALVLLFAAAPAAALEVPSLEGRVNDHAQLIEPARAGTIERRLAEYEQTTGHQFVVLTIDSLEGDPLEDFSLRTVEKWKLGHKKADDGLLLLVVKKERKVRIEVGYGLEGNVTDAVSSRVIRNVITPAFREGNYGAGIDRALTALMQADTGKPSGGDTSGAAPDAGGQTDGRRGGSPFLIFLLLPLIIVFLIIRWLGGGGGGGGYGGYRGYGGYGGWGTGAGMGGGSWGGGGGGGFSGGGGGFGGGGASGSW